jgi:hypothetical protein
MPPPEKKKNDKNVDAAWGTVGQAPSAEGFYDKYSPETLAQSGSRGTGRPDISLVQLRDAINLVLQNDPSAADPAEYDAERSQTEANETLGAVEAAYDAPDRDEISQLDDAPEDWQRQPLPEWFEAPAQAEMRRREGWDPTPRAHYEEPGPGWLEDSRRQEPPPARKKGKR